MKTWTPAQWAEFFDALSLMLLESSLSIAFVGGIFAILYALISVTQPMWGQSLNDKAFIAILTPLMIFLPTIIDKIIAKKSEKKAAKQEAENVEPV
jgi:hypothetical protein